MIDAVSEEGISLKHRRPTQEEVAPGLIQINHVIVNSYLVADHNRSSWVLVDAGLVTSKAKIIETASRYFGKHSKPHAIILTHGHFDHTGSVESLAEHWNVPIYAHPLELPYLTGLSAYPPPDPTVGGGMVTLLSRFFPHRPINLGKRLKVLAGNGVVPGISDWRWIHTPGHTAGHVALFRDSDHTLVSGDAFITVKQESMSAVLRQRQIVWRPPAYFTSDWETSLRSIERLAALDPEIAATGHGLPMRGEALRDGLENLLRSFRRVRPHHGRYARQPALTNELGVVSIPPPRPDPWIAIAGSALALTLTALLVRNYKRESRYS